MLELGLELPPAVVTLVGERAAGERCLNPAARLSPVRTVGEAAERCRRGDVVEGLGEALLRLPEAQLAHPGRVEEKPACREAKQLAVRRRVAAAAVGSEVARGHQRLACQAVDERRLADARRPEGGDGAARGEVRRELLDAFSGEVADDVHRNADRRQLHLEDRRLDVRAQIGLRQDDHRLRPALHPSAR